MAPSEAKRSQAKLETAALFLRVEQSLPRRLRTEELQRFSVAHATNTLVGLRRILGEAHLPASTFHI